MTSFSEEQMIWDGVLVIGAGLAGLSAALGAAESGRAVLLVSPAPLGEGCASAWAQGGMAAALSAGDHPALHAADTIAAGAGLVDPAMAALLAEEGPAAVARLEALGVPFDRDGDGGLHQGLEAAHSRARIARVGGDGAGRAIIRAVAAATAARPSVRVLEGLEARALVKDECGRAAGALFETRSGVVRILASAVVLAAGGLGALYAVTTNPPEARGSGMALAALVGAVIADPEFVQFHPTAMDLGRDPAPLATEALRGEGARLVDASGSAFMARYHPGGDLAPRDVVARAVEQEIAAGRGAYLDARQAVGEAFPEAFPAVFAACRAAGLDPRLSPIPVAPAAHYHMGGVRTDALGQTSVEGLFAAGECASTGVHGANRLASNSLLEAAVFGARAGQAAAAVTLRPRRPEPASAAPRLPEAARQRLRAAMSRWAGVARSEAGLVRLGAELDELRLAHGATLEGVSASLVAAAALARKESRGGHFRLDFPEAGPVQRTFLTLEALEPRRAAA